MTGPTGDWLSHDHWACRQHMRTVRLPADSEGCWYARCSVRPSMERRPAPKPKPVEPQVSAVVTPLRPRAQAPASPPATAAPATIVPVPAARASEPKPAAGVTQDVAAVSAPDPEPSLTAPTALRACDLPGCAKPARPKSKYCSRTCSNRNARRRFRARKKTERQTDEPLAEPAALRTNAG